MPDYVRVADFQADEAAIDGFLTAVESESGPPEGANMRRTSVDTFEMLLNRSL